MAVEISTALFPRQLLARTRSVEHRMGRQRIIAKGPRTIDIDILLFDRAIIRSPDLIVPHARMTQRRFVLEPLAELVPDLREPVTHKTIAALLTDVLNQKVRRLTSDE